MLKVHVNSKGNRKVETLSDHENSAIEDIQKERIVDENFLDIGCGKGKLVFELGKIGKECVGVDISKADMVCSLKKAKKTKVHFVLSDATLLPFRNDTFKVITAIDIIEHLSNYKKFICECKRVLKNGGLIYIHTPNRLQTNLRKKLTGWKGWCDEHVHEFYPSELINLLKMQGFQNIEILRLDGLWMLKFLPSVFIKACSRIFKLLFLYDGFHLKAKK